MMATLTRRQMLALLPAVGAAGCGYTLAGRGSFLPDYIRIIGIPAFGNTTPYQTVEQIFTDKVRVEFQSRGQYTAVPTETGADGIVRGTISGISAVPVAFTDSQLARRYRFTVVVGVSFEDVRQKKKLWENPALNFSDEYELASATSAGLRRLGVSRPGARRRGSHVHGLRPHRRQRHPGGLLTPLIT